MPDAATLLELAAKVEAASGPDREIDAEVMIALGWSPAGQHGREPRWVMPDGVQTAFNPQHGAPYSLTSSLDAVMAKIRHLLPGWGWRLTQQSSLRADPPNALLYAPTIDRDFEADAATPALALLAATLRALAQPPASHLSAKTEEGDR